MKKVTRGGVMMTRKGGEKSGIVRRCSSGSENVKEIEEGLGSTKVQ